MNYKVLYNYIVVPFIYILFTITLNGQTKKHKVYFPYTDTCLTVKENKLDANTSSSEINILIFENDSLFATVNYIETNIDTISILQECQKKPFIQILLLGNIECVYFLDANKKALAACYPDGTNYEMQWFYDGKDSMLKQWEMVTINANFNESLSSSDIEYNKEVLVRRIDRNGNPEDFELTIIYFDKNRDGIIEKVVQTMNND